MKLNTFIIVILFTSIVSALLGFTTGTLYHHPFHPQPFPFQNLAFQNLDLANRSIQTNAQCYKLLGLRYGSTPTVD